MSNEPKSPIYKDTARPTGLSIKRKGNAFTFTWKCGSKNYDAGQQLQFAVKNSKTGWGDWISIDVGDNIRTKTREINFGNWFPSAKKKLAGVRFRVRGKRANTSESVKWYDKEKKKYKHKDVTTIYNYSPWTQKSFTIKKPKKATTGSSWNEQTPNQARFNWSVGTNDKGRRIFQNVEWEAILVKNTSTSIGKKAGKWNSSNRDYRHGTSADPTNSHVITENSALLAQTNNAYTRWFRVRARGPRGASSWVYSRHRYAKPNQPEIQSARATKTGAKTTKIYVSWKTPRNGARPIDFTSVEYIMAAPMEGMEPPAGETWTEAETGIKDNKGLAASAFVIDGQIGVDQAIFVRVVNHHDNKVTYSEPKIPKGAVGRLENPTIESLEFSSDTHRATITFTNESEVTDSVIAVLYKNQGQNNDKAVIIGVFDTPGTYTVQAPDWGTKTPKFGVRAFLGEYEEVEGDITTYNFPDPTMTSYWIWSGGDVPKAPQNVTVTPTVIAGAGSINVTWDRPWTESDGSQLGWADHADAWNSTDQPETYDVPGIYESNWNIAGLETGKTWYVAVRLSKGAGDEKTYGDWSSIIPVSLSSIPAIPALQLSEDVIPEDGSVQASWAYVSADGTAQASASLCFATVSDTGAATDHTEPFMSVTGAQYVTLTAADIIKAAEEVGYTADGAYNICVQVTSVTGTTSEGWSAPAPIAIQEPPSITINSTSFEQVTITTDAEEELTETVTALTDMPFKANISGAGTGGITRVVLERAADYFMERPDETDFNGFEGEAVATAEISGEGEVEIDLDDLVGHLDDGAQYRMIATVEDTYGQRSPIEDGTIDFLVVWEHQAKEPTATVSMDYEHNAAIITPQAPTGALATDTCDIYRLSTDRPELIYPNAQFGETYVDPFPAFGEHGGHRIVTKTANGDYITEDNGIAWLDTRANADDYIYQVYGLIDFGGRHVRLMYNVDVSNEWNKDFVETHYLGGSVQGDWNVGISRTGTIQTELINLLDEDQVEEWRRLANYAGICHIRTADGSSFNADVQITENRPHENQGRWTSFNIQFTRVDPEGYDGLTLAEWQKQIEE